jgi:hypothetical protein
MLYAWVLDPGQNARCNMEPANCAEKTSVLVEIPVMTADQHSPDSSMAEAKIEMRLGRLAQLFNSLDPSPFHERDLDHDAEEYIIGSAEEIGRQRPLRLVIHLPPDQVPQSGAHDLGEAIHNYFAYRAVHEERRLRTLFRDGRIALVTGLTFLLCCMLLRELTFSFGPGAVSDIVGEGMLIIGWVAMWRPLEIFLYEWVPIRRRCRILAKLVKMPVVVESK